MNLVNSAFAGAQVLVVDDEEGVTRLCERFLARAGFEVQTANQPSAGIGILENQKIDLLLADVRMPQMDGFQLLKLARERRPDLAVVIMTGYGTVETAVESLHQGADGMILKPFSGAELVQSVEQALRDRQREREVQRLQALRPLFAISQSLFAEKSPLQLRAQLMDVLSRHLGCAHASLYQYDPERQTWQQASLQGQNFDISAWLPTSGHPIPSALLADATLQSEMSQHNLGHAVALPFIYGAAPQLLLVARRLGEADFDESELETLRILSRQAAAALENAELYDELQKRILQVEASQKALIQAEKMAAVGRLTASIAHELNNPLHSISNCLHLARRVELSEANRQEYLDLAADELERLMHTVRQMLDFYRPGALDRKPLQIDALVDKVAKLLEAQLSAHKIQFNRRFAVDLPPVLAVENQIQQVFFNLFLNAIEAMPSGGEITVTSALDGMNISVWVADTGPGIASESDNEIFDPFVSTKEKGLGLGLTISYGIVTAHGGSLSVVPDYKHGACFKLLLPAYVAE